MPNGTEIVNSKSAPRPGLAHAPDAEGYFPGFGHSPQALRVHAEELGDLRQAHQGLGAEGVADVLGELIEPRLRVHDRHAYFLQL